MCSCEQTSRQISVKIAIKYELGLDHQCPPMWNTNPKKHAIILSGIINFIIQVFIRKPKIFNQLAGPKFIHQWLSRMLTGSVFILVHR